MVGGAQPSMRRARGRISPSTVLTGRDLACSARSSASDLANTDCSLPSRKLRQPTVDAPWPQPCLGIQMPGLRCSAPTAYLGAPERSPNLPECQRWHSSSSPRYLDRPAPREITSSSEVTPGAELPIPMMSKGAPATPLITPLGSKPVIRPPARSAVAICPHCHA
jgi:hypothetical protein